MIVVLLLLGILIGLIVGAAGAAAVLKPNRERARDELAAISADVLKQTGDSLAQRLADQRRAEEERASGEMTLRSEEIKRLVGPVHEKLTKVEGELGRLERERRDGQVKLSEMVRTLMLGTDTLHRETRELVSALKRPETRGSWGEIQLRRVVELAGMVAHCDFVEQSTIHTEDGRLRPDMLVRLPGGKLIVVDSKVPLDAYLASLESSPEDAGQLQARHAKQTRDHITKLASKGYQRQFDSTPELVVMFVPSDGIYQAALAADPALIEYGVAQHVLMATPTTLIGLLRAVHYGWGQERIAESAREVVGSAREMHRRVGKFAEHLAKVGRQLDSAVGSYNAAVGSFDHRVIPQMRSIEQAGISSEREIAAPAAIETTARPVTAQLESELDEPSLNAKRLEPPFASSDPHPGGSEAGADPVTARLEFDERSDSPEPLRVSDNRSPPPAEHAASATTPAAGARASRVSA